MKRLVQSSQDALAEESFGASLKAAKEALALPEGAENARLHILAGRAALGLKDFDQAEQLLVRACQLDDSLMAAPARLADVYDATGELAKFAEVRERQMTIASAKGSDDKSVQFGLDAAHAYGRAKNYAASRRIFLRAITWNIDHEARLAALDVLLRIHHECYLDDLARDELTELSLQYLQTLHATPPEAIRETFLTPNAVAEVAVAHLAYGGSTADLERFCKALFKATTHEAPVALATSILLALALDASGRGERPADFGPGRPLIDIIADNCSAAEDTYGQVWRAWALAARMLADDGRLAEARACCDRALLKLRAARDAFDRAQQSSSQGNKPAKKQTKVISFSSVAAAAAEPAKGTPQSRRDDLAKRKVTLLGILCKESPQLWNLRSDMLLRTFVQGSKGRTHDARAAARAAQEGLSAASVLLDASETGQLCFAARAGSGRAQLAALQLEAASYAIPLEGNRLAVTSRSKVDDEVTDAPARLARAVFGFFNGGDTPPADLVEPASMTMLEQRAAAALQAAAALKRGELAAAAAALKIACQPPAAPGQDTETLAARLRLDGAKPPLTPVLPWYLCLQGETFLAAGNAANATKFLLKAAQLDPQLARTFHLLGNIYEQKGDAARALKCYEKSLALEPAQAELLNLVAARLWARQQASHVVDLYKRAVAFVDDLALKGSDLHPFRDTYTDAWIRLGRLALWHNAPEEAERCFQRAIAGDQHRFDAWQGLGDAYARTGKREGALMALATAVSCLDESSIPADQRAYVYMRLGRLHLENEAFDDAVEALEKANDIFASQATGWTLARARLLRASALITADRYEAASDEITRGLSDLDSHGPKHELAFNQVRARLLALRANALPVAGDQDELAYAQAMRNHAKVTFAEPWCVAAWQAMGECAVRSSQQSLLAAKAAPQSTADGRRCAEVALAFDPEDARSWTLLGTSHGLGVSSGSADSEATQDAQRLAQHCWVRATQLDPSGATAAWSNLGLLFERRGRIDPALRAFTEAQAGHRHEKAVSWAARGRIAIAHRSEAKVLATMRCALEAVPPGTGAPCDLDALVEYVRQNLRLAWARLGRRGWATVEDASRRILRRAPQHALGHFAMGLALLARRADTARISYHLRRAPLQMAHHHLIAMNILPAEGAPQDLASISLASPSEFTKSVIAARGVATVPPHLAQEDKVLAFCADASRAALPPLPQASSEGDELAAAAQKAGRAGEVAPGIILSAAQRAKLFVARQSPAEAIACAPWDATGWISRARDALAARPLVEVEARAPRRGKSAGSVGRCMETARTVYAGSRLDLACLLEAAAWRSAGDQGRAFSCAAKAYYAAPYSRRAAQLFVGSVRTPVQAQAVLPVARRLAWAPERTTLDVLRFAEASSLSGDEQAALEAADLLRKMEDSRVPRGVAEVLVARAKRSPQDFCRALEQMPPAPLLWVELAMLVATAGENEAAADCLAQAVNCFQDNAGGPEATETECFVRLAQAEFLASKFGVGRSLGGMNKAAKTFPGDARVHLVRGWLALLQGNSDAKSRKATMASLRRSLEIDPANDLAQELVDSLEAAAA